MLLNRLHLLVSTAPNLLQRPYSQETVCLFLYRQLPFGCILIHLDRSHSFMPFIDNAGIGPEIADAVQKIFEAADVPIQWDIQKISKEVDPRTNSFITRENLDSVLVRLQSIHY